MQSKIILLVVVAVVLGGIFYSFNQYAGQPQQATKLYWFIPDGVRTEPDLFTMYKWAQEGKLPNIKKMMDRGAYGYSIPDFPSHTPTNFASLLTGAHPTVHGVADGPMHIEGKPLARPSVGGFNSAAKKVDPIWTILEKVGKKITLLSIPGSTPPELKNGITVRGRWGGWGADTPAIIFEPTEKLEERKIAGKGFRLFFLGQKLTRFVDKIVANDWQEAPISYSVAQEAKIDAYGQSFFSYIYDSSDDGEVNYDRVIISLDKKSSLVDLAQGEWSDWYPVTLSWNDKSFDSAVKIKVIKLWDSSNFRIRLFFNNINEFITEPSFVAADLTKNVGPMMDFADNWPAQLVYEEEDKDTFLEEAQMTLDWHKRAAGFILDEYKPDVFLQDIYTPNQMLESRWWHREIDTNRPEYSEERAKEAWDDILWLYQGLDAIMGEAMEKADKDTLFVFSSDHGVIPLYKQVRLNNLFAQKGWLKFSIDETTGESSIDWANTKVIFLKMNHIYIDPNGLEGDWNRASGAAYEALRDEVMQVLADLEDTETGIKPLVQAQDWEDAPVYFELPTDRVGDIVLEITPGYTWWEEVTADFSVFTVPITSGYKQAVNAKITNGMWTPFLIMGPGVKAGQELKEPISHVDQLPTILKLLNVDIPSYVQGRVLSEILE